jgi:drug/metabolite transporter (DMT)-like permease
VFVALAAWLWLGEELGTFEWLGLLLVGLSILSLAFPALLSSDRKPSSMTGVLLALLNALAISAYLLVDGKGVRVDGAAMGYIVWNFVVMSLPFIAIGFWWRRGQGLGDFRPILKVSLMGSLVSCLSYALVLYAVSLQPLGPVVALRESSVIMAAIFGTLFLKEAFGLSRLIAAAGVFTGLVILKIF